jgi:RimJ/RimL family protein N-acetyltransferase
VSYSIRRLTRDDAEAYRAIRLEALTNHPESFGASPEAFGERSLDDLRELLDHMAFFGAETDKAELAGIIAYFRDTGERERHRGWLIQVYLKPSLRGTGCAEALIEAAVEHARTEVLQVHLGVGTHNAPAIRLYQKVGFAIYGTDPRALLVNGRYIDEHLMVRFLDKAPGK